MNIHLHTYVCIRIDQLAHTCAQPTHQPHRTPHTQIYTHLRPAPSHVWLPLRTNTLSIHWQVRIRSSYTHKLQMCETWAYAHHYPPKFLLWIWHKSLILHTQNSGVWDLELCLSLFANTTQMIMTQFAHPTHTKFQGLRLGTVPIPICKHYPNDHDTIRSSYTHKLVHQGARTCAHHDSLTPLTMTQFAHPAHTNLKGAKPVCITTRLEYSYDKIRPSHTNLKSTNLLPSTTRPHHAYDTIRSSCTHKYEGCENM